MWMTLLLTFLRNNWKFIAISLMIGSVLAYIYFLKVSRDFYKGRLESIKIEFTAYKDKIQAETEAFEELAFRADKEANQKILAQEKQIEEQRIALTQRIKNDKGIRGIVVPSNSIRLFNESTGPSTTTGDPKGTSQEANPPQASTSTQVDLSTVFEIMVENNLNHQKCIDQVDGLHTWYNKLRQESLKYENPS